MEHSYIQFDDPASKNPKRATNTKGILQKILVSVLSTFIPKANPDYDEIIDNVAQWLLEIDHEDNKPVREIGIDKAGQTIMILPWRDNYGYWSDNDITVNYFNEHFKAVNIDKAIFDTRWDAFLKSKI